MEKKQQRIGSRERFRELHKSTYDALFYYLYSRTADKQLAEDILQEAYILLWEKREDLKDLPAVKTFMYITVRNKLMTHNRDTSTRHRLLENATGLFDDGGGRRPPRTRGRTYRAGEVGRVKAARPGAAYHPT